MIYETDNVTITINDKYLIISYFEGGHYIDEERISLAALEDRARHLNEIANKHWGNEQAAWEELNSSFPLIQYS